MSFVNTTSVAMEAMATGTLAAAPTATASAPAFTVTSFPTGFNTTLVAQVETQMAAWEASLKLCGQQCWTSLFSVPPTDKDVLAFCLNNATAQFNSCAQQACSTDDFSYCQAVVSIIPSTCEIYGITASTFENAGSFAAPSPVFVSATASAAAGAVGAGGSAVNTTSKSGVVGPVCVGVASLVAALLVI